MSMLQLWSVLNPWGLALARILLAVLWQSTLLMAAIGLLTWALRRRPASLRHALWVGAILLMPLLPAMSHVLGSARVPQVPVRVEAVALPAAALPAVAELAMPSAGKTAPILVTPASSSEEPAILQMYARPWTVVVLLYAFGLTLMLGWLGTGLFRLRQWVRRAVPVTEARALAAFDLARERSDLSGPVEVVKSSDVPTALTLGLVKPVVLLPKYDLEHLSESDMQKIALHECAHVRRRDNLWLWMTLLMRTLFFFQPILWWACRQATLLAEESCDEAVVASTGEALPYADLLARLADRTVQPSISTRVAAGLLLTRSAFVRRAEAIIAHSRSSLGRPSPLVIGTTLLAALLCVTLAVAVPLSEEGKYNHAAGPASAARVFVAQHDVPASTGSRESKEEQRMAAMEGIKLEFTGDAFMKDSFSLVMLAAARHYGKQADYETIYMLSTIAFAPDVCPVEACRATWRLLGRGACLDLVARRFGLAVRQVQLPEERPTPPADERGRTWGTPAYNRWLAERMRDCSAVLRKELVPGAIVITDGGWQREWHQWGIVTEAQPDGRIAGMTPDRPEPNSMDHDEHYWVLTAGGRGLTPEEADWEMLRRAIHRIRGDQEPFLPKRKMVFGLQAMDLWIAQMEKPVFQEDDPGSSAANARLNALYAYEGATAVVSYLRGRLPTFPKPAQAHIERAVQRYELIAGLLQPYSVWEQGSGYRSGEGTATPLIGTLGRQRDHAETVLKPVRVALVAAAEELEKALAAVAQEAGG